MTESAPLSEDELMALWERGRRIALARCSHSLRALRQGGGGFYEADDLWQDLFLDFMELARRWHGRPAPRRAEDLWAAWRRHLWQGGRRVLRRRPQRLWRKPERAVDPREMELGEDPSEERTETSGLTPAAHEALIEGADMEEAWGIGAETEAAESRLWGPSPTNRQALYLKAVVGLSSMEVARCLALVDIETVHRRVHCARASLRRGMRASAPSQRGDSRP